MHTYIYVYIYIYNIYIYTIGNICGSYAICQLPGSGAEAGAAVAARVSARVRRCFLGGSRHD